MKLARLLASLLKSDESTHHPDSHISEFILKELLNFEMKVKAENYCPPSSSWKTHEEFVSDLDKLITTFSILRTNDEDTKIYDDIEVQKGLLLFIRMYRNLCFLELPEETDGK